MKYSKLMVTMLMLGFFTSVVMAGGELKSKKDKESYGVGVDVANNFKNMDLDLNLEVLFKGMRDVYAGKKLAMDEAEITKVMTVYHNELRNKQMAAHKAIMDANQKAGDEFIAKYKAAKDVVSLPSGVLYKVIKEGSGQKPSLSDTVESRYKGFFVDGKEFDSSERTGGAVSFNLQGVIPGWQEVLQLMPVGSHWEVVVPAKLAYGAQGAGRQIGPNATLIFDIELLSIKAKEADKAAPSIGQPQK
jgi:FKBP-type peptidyl-prolyl cis-trans isomerase